MCEPFFHLLPHYQKFLLKDLKNSVYLRNYVEKFVSFFNTNTIYYILIYPRVLGIGFSSVPSISIEIKRVNLVDKDLKGDYLLTHHSPVKSLLLLNE